MGLLTCCRAVAAVSVLSLVLSACGSDSSNTAAPSPTPTPTASPSPTPETPTPTPTPSKTSTSKPITKPAPPRCVGTFQGGRFTLRATNGGGINGGAFSCGEGGNFISAERLRDAVRFYVGDKVATIRPGKTVAIGGYNIRVRLVKGSTAVFDVARR